MQSNDDFLALNEAARLTGFSHWSIRRWVGTKLTRYESMGRVMISRAELLELVKPKKAGSNNDHDCHPADALGRLSRVRESALVALIGSEQTPEPKTREESDAVPDVYRRLVASADIAVGVLLNAAGADVEYIPLAPRTFPERMAYALEIEWSPRNLHFAGVMTWTEGSGVRTQLEPLPASAVVNLTRGFAAYLASFSTDSKPTN